MSIEIRVITLSRSFRSLIEKQRSVSKFIKDLKDLKSFRIAAAIDMQDLKDLKRRFFIVARGPVPRDLHRYDVCFPLCSLCSPDHKQVRISDPDLQSLARERSRGTGPRATVKAGR